MGADFSRELEAQLKQQQQQEQQPQLQSRPQSQPQPQPQQQLQQPQLQLQPQPQPRPQHQQQQQQQPQLQLQPQSQPQPQQQPQSNGRTSREKWVLSPQREAKPSTGKAKEGVKPNGTQSLTPVKPLKEPNLSYRYEDILKHADSPVDKFSREKMCDQLCAGVFLDHKTKKYWLEKYYANCFMLYARSLSITWAENQSYWKWVQQKEESGSMIEVAELKRVCWLEVNGRFDTRKLSPAIKYEVSFVVMLKDQAQGWEVPVNFRLVLPGGRKVEHQENFNDRLRMRWIEIPVGVCVPSELGAGDMEFSMYEYGGIWKQGLVIKGVVIKPKNED